MTKKRVVTFTILLLICAIAILGVYTNTALSKSMFAGIAVPILVYIAMGLVSYRIYLAIQSTKQDTLSGSVKRPLLRALFPLCVFGAVFMPAFDVGFDLYSRKILLHRDVDAVLNSSNLVRAEIGTPVRTGWPIKPDIHTSSNEGRAVLTIPLYGSRDIGALVVHEYESLGIWGMQSIYLRKGWDDTEKCLYGESSDCEGHAQ